MRDRDPLFSGEVRALSAAIALACLILAAVVVSEIGAFVMKRLVTLAAIGAAAIALAGCQALTGFNSALIPQLKPVDARIHTDVTCGDMAAQVLGVTASTNQLTASQAVAIVQFCERRDATQTLTLDPQGGRKVLEGIVNKPPGVGAVAAVAAP